MKSGESKTRQALLFSGIGNETAFLWGWGGNHFTFALHGMHTNSVWLGPESETEKRNAKGHDLHALTDQVGAGVFLLLQALAYVLF
jgi:hypothetical protein